MSRDGATGTDEMGSDECMIAQQDECDSMSAIFDEDFTLLCRDPISFSIALSSRSGDCDCDAGGGRDDASPGKRLLATTSPNHRLMLVVSYPEMYPLVAPILRLSVVVPDDDDDDVDDGATERKGRIPPLHPLQERVVLDSAYASITAPGEPCVYGCVVAARDCIDRGGLIQAGISTLSDDCLVRILTYVAHTARDVEDARVALPIFGIASTRNAIWRPMCKRRWGDRWGYRGRWERANRNYRRRRPDGGTSPTTTTTTNIDDDDNRMYWMRAYLAEEADATRDALSREELCSMTFDLRPWFSSRSFRNQPDNMRDVLPTGLRESAGNVVFEKSGMVCGSPIWRGAYGAGHKWVGLERNGNVNDGVITQVGVGFTKYIIHRTLNWGWELRGSDFILRAIDRDDLEDRGDEYRDDELWGDLIRGIVLQERPHWVRPTRFHDYNYREIPDDEDCKSMLGW
jgi:hypothetical protein